MIEQIEAVNFRRHRTLSMAFGPGLTVLKGANEAGKSTVFEVVAYALFGAKALRNSLADTVTWGEKDTTLKVACVLNVSDVKYTFKRGKSGAECTWGDKMVTGQSEVSDFAASLIGADPATAAKLMLSNQGALRGALDAGPKATSELIEGLANFDLFEEIIEKMQAKLTLGSTSAVEARIAEAEKALEEFFDIGLPDTTHMREKLQILEDELATNERWLEEFGKPQEALAAKLAGEAEEKQEAHNKAMAAWGAAIAERARLQDKLKEAQEAVSKTPDTAHLEQLQGQLAQALKQGEVEALYRKFEALAAYKGAVWEGDAESLDAEIAATAKLIKDFEAEGAELRGSIREAKARMVTTSHCGYCSLDVSQFPAIAAQNQASEAILQSGQTRLDTLAGSIKDAEAELATLRQVLRAGDPARMFVAQNSTYVEADLARVPMGMEWIADKPGMAADPAEMKRQIVQAQVEAAGHQRVVFQVEMLQADLQAIEEVIRHWAAELDKYPSVPNLEALKTTAQDTANARAIQQFHVDTGRQQRASLVAEIAMFEAELARHEVRRKELFARSAAAQQELDDLGFNNALLKKVRAARPVISDKLWNTVLAAVSSMFSQMRGDVSVVSKGKDGFCVNGEAFTSLSGSTLDLLGLAIRIALVKTFIPASTFLVLDEPFAACDDERSARMLGFIASSGFAQTIVITHEDNSEAVADTLINL